MDFFLSFLQFLVDKAVDRDPPLQDDIEKAIEKKYDEQFKTNKGAVVDYASATSLLNRYCFGLPCDIFTVPAVQWIEKTHKIPHLVAVLLPIQSPLRDEITVSK